jgi:septum formation protein
VTQVTLASKSAIRAAILRGAGVSFEVVSPSVDEASVKEGLLAHGGTPRSVAEALAVMKAVAVSRDRPGLVIGADQTLDLAGALYDKATSPDEARERLTLLKGRTHALHAAVAVARDGAAVWRHVETARLTMRAFTDRFLDGYLTRAGTAILDSVGGYQLEGEGAQLFEEIDGDYFSVLGLPLIPLLDALRREGALAQ